MDSVATVAGLADLRASLFRLDLRLRLAVEAQRTDLTERARDPFRGLYISEADVDALLASTPAADLARIYLAEPAAVSSPRLDRLARLYQLDAFEQEALLVCLAADVDLRYERLFAYLQDDVTRRRPTVDLVLRLIAPSLEERATARTALGPGGRLITRGLLAVPAEDSATQTSLLARPLRVDERVVDYLLGSDSLDPRIGLFAQLSPVNGEAAHWTLPDGVQRGLIRLLDAARDSTTAQSGTVAYLHGAAGSGKRATARAACERAGWPLLLVDLPTLIAASTEKNLVSLLAGVAREALLQNAVLCLEGFDGLLGDDPDVVARRGHLQRVLLSHPGPTLLLGEERWEPALWLPGVRSVRIELRALGVAERVTLWRSQLDGQLAADVVAQLAARYRVVDDDNILAVATDAVSRAVLRGGDVAAPEDFRMAARALATPPLEGLARRIEPRYGWSDIVVPQDGLAQLREICARLRHQGTVLEQWGYGRKHARRGGITALFAGQPGTGKTMAAEIVAGELGLELYRIDLSAVVSKYIGETEKNLERIFRAADQGDAVLLFDEADAIFGKRSEVRDARDRYANVEVAYLLQRLETYDGLAILTTNLRGNIDEAFTRRLDCVLEFPMPEEAQRLSIWRLALPMEAPLESNVDLLFLARKFKLAGGHIRNIALTAGFLAAEDGGPIGMRHLARAVRREYQKLGKLVAEADFEQYFDLLRQSQDEEGS
jgi:Winged helix domain, variant/ATPase family associated with various cellular activities (AAA)